MSGYASLLFLCCYTVHLIHSKIRYPCVHVQAADVRGSIGGKFFNQKIERFNFIRDTVVEYARKVQIRLEHIVAQYIKLDLYFDAKWILISEVQFESRKTLIMLQNLN